MQNNLPQPLFASSSSQQTGQTVGDDFDLNEIFADYFINEFDDPLNAYTSSMANYSGAAAAVAKTTAAADTASTFSAAAVTASSARSKSNSGGLALPTGGIKTAFHTGASAAVVTVAAAPGVGAQQPADKKMKLEEAAATATATAATTASGVPIPAGLSAATAPGQQLPHPGMPGQALANAAQQQVQQQQLVAAQQVAVATSGGVTLPVGVGIRLGGLGGIAPATAQGAQMQHPAGQFAAIWGGQGNGALSEQAIAERRQRNREHAKRSRVRKKFMLESLQEQVRELQRENQRLRMLVQEHIPEKGMQIIAECCQSSPLFADPEEDGGESAAAAAAAAKASSDERERQLERADFSLMSTLASGQQCFVLSDPKLPDNPIVFASPGFYKLTGYTSKQVLGRNCRFLQGPGTDAKAVDVIRKAIATGSDATVCLLNYKADGTPFWNQFFIAALRDSDNCIVNYVGVQTEVESDVAASSLEDKVNAVLPLQNKDEKDE